MTVEETTDECVCLDLGEGHDGNRNNPRGQDGGKGLHLSREGDVSLGDGQVLGEMDQGTC